MSTIVTSPTAPRSAWLFGPVADVTFGYGLAYVVSVPLLVAMSLWTSATAAAWLAPALALLISTPHYGATILRVYERPEDRRKYGLFTLWITALILALFAASLHVAVIGSVLLTLYLTWSPWHFSGQNYGIFLMFLRRKGIEPSDALRRPLYLSFVLSASLAMISLHLAVPGLHFGPRGTDPSGTFGVLRLGIPLAVAAALATGVAVAWLGCVGLVVFRLRGRARLAELGPLGVLMSMQALWYLPSIAFLTGLFDLDSAGFAFTAIWIAVAHAVQYLWVTYYYAKREGRERQLRRFFGKTWLAGGLLLAPILLLAPGLFGAAAPNTAGIAVLTIAVLNLHHFVLDGAIWKLRDGRVARILLRSEAPAPTPEPSAGGFRLRSLPALLLSVALFSLLAQGYLVLLYYGVSREKLEAPALGFAANQLAWFGQDNAQLWARVGYTFEAAGESGSARAAYRRSLQMDRQPPPWMVNRLAWLLLEGESPDARSLEQATQLAQYLVQRLGTRRAEGYQTLAAVHARAGRWGEAIAAAEKALAVAERLGEQERAALLERELLRYRSHSLGEPASSDRMPPAPPKPTPSY